MTSVRPTIRRLLAVCSLLALPALVLGDESTATQIAIDLAAYDALIHDSDREYWAYLPVVRSDVPTVADSAWLRNPIDNFILAGVEDRGWRPTAEVNSRALLRRVHLDVVGLPPTREEQERFLADESPDAYERVVDDLLSRPGYGERWGRHWLDAVRFAESNGYERDATKPLAWKYRDYVIDAFNGDKPYDRFILEQLAGDELPDASTETVLAMGYYRLGPWDDEPADFDEDRFEQLDDLVRTTSEVFLATTLGCARCHNHKFDPLTQLDYYRLVAIFDPLKRSQNGRTETLLPAGSHQQVAAIAERDKQVAQAFVSIDRIRTAARQSLLSSTQLQLQPDVIAAFQTSPDARTDAQKALVDKHAAEVDGLVTERLNEAERGEIDAHIAEIKQLAAATPNLPEGYFLHEPSPAPPTTHLLFRGRASNKGPIVQPGMPAVLVREQPQLEPANEYTTRRRLSFAKWIASADNPLTARVIVNRVWAFHFGQGLVATPNDFGAMGASPSHPELLDWLAHWFTHDAAWSVKQLHRLILTSSTYRMSKQWNAEYGAEDPENQSFWRFPYRRLEVEAIRDAMLAASGELNRKMQGESTYLSVPPEALAGHSDPGKIWQPLDEREESRRTVYAFVKRSMVVPLLEVLDLCDSSRSAEKRNVTSVPTQALTLMNGEFVNRQSARFADRLIRDAGESSAKQIELAYVLTLARPPADDELNDMLQYLESETGALQRESIAPETVRHAALTRACRVIFNLNEFAYTD